MGDGRCCFPFQRKYTLLLVPLGVEPPRDRGSHALFTVKAKPQNEALHVTVKEHGQVVLPQRTIRTTRLCLPINIQGTPCKVSHRVVPNHRQKHDRKRKTRERPPPRTGRHLPLHSDNPLISRIFNPHWRPKN